MRRIGSSTSESFSKSISVLRQRLVEKHRNSYAYLSFSKAYSPAPVSKVALMNHLNAVMPNRMMTRHCRCSVKSHGISLVVVAALSILVILACASVVVEGLPHSRPVSSQPIPGSQCSTVIPGGLALQSDTGNATTTIVQDAVFVMSPGSTAELCVTYNVTQIAAAQSLSDVLFSAKVYSFSTTPITGSGGKGFMYSFTNYTGVLTGADPEIASFSQGSTGGAVNVVYSLTALSGTNGFYSLSFTNSCPSSMPFVIGSSASQISDTDFPGFFMPSSCRAQIPLSTGIVTGYSGMQVLWISQGESP